MGGRGREGGRGRLRERRIGMIVPVKFGEIPCCCKQNVK